MMWCARDPVSHAEQFCAPDWFTVVRWAQRHGGDLEIVQRDSYGVEAA